MLDSVHPGWLPLFEAQRELLDEIMSNLEEPFLPRRERIFRAFEQSPQSHRVLILGQDPYPNPEHAVGLAFAVPAGTSPLPPSLRNILKELSDDLGIHSSDADISRWQESGVMLLNRHLTTKANETGGHFSLGWEKFTTEAVKYLVEQRQSKLVAILWGSKAQELVSDLKDVKVIASAHPSPLSSYRGFFGSRPFSRANELLRDMGEDPIDWSC